MATDNGADRKHHGLELVIDELGELQVQHRQLVGKKQDILYGLLASGEGITGAPQAQLDELTANIAQVASKMENLLARLKEMTRAA